MNNTILFSIFIISLSIFVPVKSYPTENGKDRDQLLAERNFQFQLESIRDARDFANILAVEEDRLKRNVNGFENIPANLEQLEKQTKGDEGDLEDHIRQSRSPDPAHHHHLLTLALLASAYPEYYSAYYPKYYTTYQPITTTTSNISAYEQGRREGMLEQEKREAKKMTR